MGREAKRVPMDFGWPMKKTWDGYLMPDRLRERDCGDCAGRGETPARRWASACAHMILMLSDDLRDQSNGRPMHPYFDNFYASAWGTRPSADIVELTTGLSGRELDSFGHGAVEGWQATEKIIEAAGLDPETWGFCRACHGDGTIEKYDGQRVEAEAWQPTDPPTGDGWQMWETTSEGSPTSPVFATPDELADWCVDGATIFGDSRADRRQWLSIITGEDFAHVEIAPGVIVI